ncbi:MAG: TldD/PmbA family protein [Alphaproteobacteria bacterium]
MDLKSLLRSVQVKADWIGLRYISEKINYHTVRNGNIDKNNITLDEGIMVEVLVDGQFAYCSTSLITSESIQKAAENAVRLATTINKWKLYNFNTNIRPQAFGSYNTAHQKTFDQTSLGEVYDILINASNAMKISDKIINNVAHTMVIERESLFVSSNGSDLNQKTFSTSTYLQATAQDGTEIQSRSSGFPCMQLGLEQLQKDMVKDNAVKIAQEALELLEAEECPTGSYDLILAPDQLYLQIHESIGHPLEIDRILGDERNYAGWSFIKLSDFGILQYGSPLLNVTFDPTIEGEFASYNFDDIGCKATKEYLIKDGKLLRGLGSLESQIRSGVLGVANGRTASWNRPPIDRMANINIEPGKSSYEDMVGATEKGVIMNTNRSWSIDDYRNKFQFGCEYAKLIENGKITKTLKNPNYRGVTTPFWNNLKMVGNQDCYKIWGSPFCGKGEPNQVIRVGHASPTCLFTNVEIFGGA